MVDELKRTYNEPILNAHFLAPYLKMNRGSQGLYDLIFQLLPLVPEKDHITLLTRLVAPTPEQAMR